MSDTPKLIHIEMPEVLDAMGFWQEHPSADLVPYARVDLIPEMLEAARREALEEAARKATSFLVGDPANGIPLRNPMAHEIAAAIRALAASPPTPTAVDGENSGETVGKGGA